MFETYLQTSVYRHLTGDSLLSAVCKGVFDCMPQERMQEVAPNEAYYPFLVISEVQSSADDTRLTYGYRSSVVIDVYSSTGGKRECQIIAGHVRRILHNKKIALDGGYNDAYFVMDELRTFKDPDGKTHRAYINLNSICLMNSEG